MVRRHLELDQQLPRDHIAFLLIVRQFQTLGHRNPAIDIAVVWLQLMHGYSELLIDVFCEIKERVSKPFVVCWIEPPENVRRAFNTFGICLITGTEQVIDAVGGLIEFRRARERFLVQRMPKFSSQRLPSVKASTLLPSKQVYDLLTSAGVPLVMWYIKICYKFKL